MDNSVFDHKSPNFDKLVNFGFTVNGKVYSYVTKIMSEQFEMRVDISLPNGEVKTLVTDLSTGEPYILHLVADACGAFVGAVREEYERVLEDIADKCYEKDVFKSDYAHKVIEYIRNKYGDELEYLWENFPTNAIWRRKDNDKWYGILIVLSKRKLGLDSDEKLDIIDLRIDSNILPTLIDGKKYFSAYHMNKKSWVTICLDGSLPIDEIYDWIDKSYLLAKKK